MREGTTRLTRVIAEEATPLLLPLVVAVMILTHVGLAYPPACAVDVNHAIAVCWTR